MPMKDKQRLVLYAGDALEAEETEEVRVHLDDGCPRCSRIVSDIRSMLWDPPEPVAPPSRALESLMTRIDQAEPLHPVPELEPPDAPPPSRRGSSASASGIGEFELMVRYRLGYLRNIFPTILRIFRSIFSRSRE